MNKIILFSISNGVELSIVTRMNVISLDNSTEMISDTDYRRLVRKSSSLHSRKSNPTPKFLGTAEAYFVCHIGMETFRGQ